MHRPSSTVCDALEIRISRVSIKLEGLNLPGDDAVALLFIVDKTTFVTAAIGVDENSLAVHLVVLEIALVEAAVGP